MVAILAMSFRLFFRRSSPSGTTPPVKSALTDERQTIADILLNSVGPTQLVFPVAVADMHLCGVIAILERRRSRQTG